MYRGLSPTILALLPNWAVSIYVFFLWLVFTSVLAALSTLYTCKVSEHQSTNKNQTLLWFFCVHAYHCNYYLRTGSKSNAYVLLLIYSFLLGAGLFYCIWAAQKPSFFQWLVLYPTYGFVVLTSIVSKWYLYWFCRWKSTLFRGKCCCCIMCRSCNEYCNKSTLGCQDKISGILFSCRKLFWHENLDNWLLIRYSKISYGSIHLLMFWWVQHSLNKFSSKFNNQ